MSFRNRRICLICLLAGDVHTYTFMASSTRQACFGAPECSLEQCDKSKPWDFADLVKTLLTLRKQKLPCESKVDIKKSVGDADLRKLGKIPFILEPIVGCVFFCFSLTRASCMRPGGKKRKKKHTDHERVQFLRRLNTRGLPYTHAAQATRHVGNLNNVSTRLTKALTWIYIVHMITIEILTKSRILYHSIMTCKL